MGSVWRGGKTPYILAQSAVPVAMQSNGTIAVNGIVTLVTALPTTYSGGIWLRFPAGAVVGGLTGLYWVVMSSTTQGQVYTNFHDAATQFTPSIPSGTLVAAVGSGAAYTQTTGADVTLVNIALPGGAMGASGALRLSDFAQWINNANNKTLKAFLGSSAVLFRTVAATVSGNHHVIVRNRSQISQVIMSATAGNAFTGAETTGVPALLAINTSVNQAVLFTLSLAVATDYAIIDGFTVEVLPS